MHPNFRTDEVRVHHVTDANTTTFSRMLELKFVIECLLLKLVKKSLILKLDHKMLCLNLS